ALAIELLDALARALHHRVVVGDDLLVGKRTVAGLHLGLVVAHLEPLVSGADHAADVAAVGEVDLLIAMVAVHDVTGADHVGVLEVHAGVAVGVGIVVMRQDRLAATHLDRLRATDIGLFRNRVARERRRLVAGGAVGGAGEQADADIVLRDRDN